MKEFELYIDDHLRERLHVAFRELLSMMPKGNVYKRKKHKTMSNISRTAKQMVIKHGVIRMDNNFWTERYKPQLKRLK